MARKTDPASVVLPLGLVALGFTLLNRIVPPTDNPPGPGEGPVGDPEEQEPTLSFERMQQLADTIDQALIQDPWSEDEQAAINALWECRNDADVAGLIAVFGNRSEGPLFPSFTLPGAVTYYLSDVDKYILNAGLRALGITYTFH